MTAELVYNIVEKGLAVLIKYTDPSSLPLQNESDLECTDAKFGELLEDFELNPLLEQLRSTDDYFFRKYPIDRSFILKEREIFAKQLEEHCKICNHCKLKVQEDNNWKLYIEDTFRKAKNNRLKSETSNSNFKNQKVKIKKEISNNGVLAPDAV